MLKDPKETTLDREYQEYTGAKSKFPEWDKMEGEDDDRTSNDKRSTVLSKNG